MTVIFLRYSLAINGNIYKSVISILYTSKNSQFYIHKILYKIRYLHKNTHKVKGDRNLVSFNTE